MLLLAMEIVSLVVFSKFTVDTVLGGESESSILMNLKVAVSLVFCSFFCEIGKILFKLSFNFERGET